MKCSKCGADITDGAKFCIGCGTPVSEDKSVAGDSPDPVKAPELKMSGSLAGAVDNSAQTQQYQPNQQDQSAGTSEESRQTPKKINSKVITPVHRQQEPTASVPVTQVNPASAPRMTTPVTQVNPASAPRMTTPVTPVNPVSAPKAYQPVPPPVNKAGAIASCARCGASIPADKMYCDRCFMIESGEEEEKKSHFGIIIGIIIGVLVLILGGIAFLFRDEIGEMFSKDSSGDDFKTVHTALTDLVEDEDFQDANADERYEMAMDVVDSLDEQNVIDGGSFDDSDRSYIYFELSDGTECIIGLEDQGDGGYLGYYGSAGKTANASCRLMTYPEEISGIDAPYVDGDKSALIIDGTDDEAISGKLKECAEDWSECHLSSEVESEFTVEDFKERLKDYDYVNIFCHGVMLEGSGKFYIRTNEEVSVKSMDKYREDAAEGRIAVGYFPGRADYLVKPGLLEHYYGKGELSDTILWISSCYAMENSQIEDALEAAECRAIAGFSGVNMAEYDILLQDAVINYMMRGTSFFDSATLAITDLSSQGYSPEKDSELKFLGEKTSGLFTLTDEAVEKLEKAKIKTGNVKISVEYDDGSEFSGTISIVSDAYEDFEEAGESRGGDEAVFTINEGKYIITVSDGVNSIEVNQDIKFETDADGNVLDYVVPVITMESPVKYPEMVDLVYDNLSVWTKYMTDEYGVSDDFYFWFQDMNMDGNPEFVVGPTVSGAHSCHAFSVWKENNGRFERMDSLYNADYMTNDILMWHNYTPDMDFSRPSANIDSFYVKLYKSNGKYVYIYPISDGDAGITVMAVSSISCPGGEITEEFRIERSSGDAYAAGDTYYVKGKKVSAEKFKEAYEDYCKSLTPVNTFTEKLSYNDLKTSTEKIWKEKLNSSYEAWAAKDSSGSVNLGFNSYVSKMKNDTNPTTDDDDPIFVGKVNTEKDPLNVRESPSKEAKILGQIDKGTLVDVFDEENGWYVIKYKDKTAYVSAEYIEIFDY